MPDPARFTSRLTIGGNEFTSSASIDFDSLVQVEPSIGIARAKNGSLTTRTDNDTGQVTLESGHGIATSDIVSVFWIENGVRGARRNMTVGTVAGNVVPIDGGSGDNLPTVNATITLHKPEEHVCVVTGNDVQIITVQSDAHGFAVFCKSDNTVLHAVEIDTPGGTYEWHTGSGISNPLAGAAVGEVHLSHGDGSSARGMRVILGVNTP